MGQQEQFFKPSFWENGFTPLIFSKISPKIYFMKQWCQFRRFLLVEACQYPESGNEKVKRIASLHNTFDL